MSTPTRIAMQLPTRVATGAFILNSGLGKWRAEEERSKHIHAMAADAYPAFADLDHRQFTKMLAAGEIALGGALLCPLVPSWLAGAGLTAFSGGLLGLYARLPGMHEQGGIRPTDDGLALAKDSWLLSIGASMVLGSLADAPRRLMKRRQRRRKVSTS
jgi:hypothetical protein